LKEGGLTAVCQPQQKRRLAAAWAEGPTGRLLRIPADDIGAFLAAGKLTPGPYQLDNYHLDRTRDGKLTFNADGDPLIVLPAERTFTFMGRKSI